jgi:hypothetical protein
MLQDSIREQEKFHKGDLQAPADQTHRGPQILSRHHTQGQHIEVSFRPNSWEKKQTSSHKNALPNKLNSTVRNGMLLAIVAIF